jgi:hypothetical protein
MREAEIRENHGSRQNPISIEKSWAQWWVPVIPAMADSVK